MVLALSNTKVFRDRRLGRSLRDTDSAPPISCQAQWLAPICMLEAVSQALHRFYYIIRYASLREPM